MNSGSSAEMLEKAGWLSRFVAEVIDLTVLELALLPMALGVGIGFGLVKDS